MCRLRTLKRLAVLMTLFMCSAFAVPGIEDDGTALTVQQFEVEWLVGNLNADRAWLERFFAGTMKFIPGPPEPIKERAKYTADLLDPAVPDDARKVRISGTISFVTNDPARNRSFRFLDTLNRKDGKWEVIASSFAPIGGSADVDAKTIEKELLGLEDALAQADVTNDRSIFDRIIAPEFVGTSASGNSLNRAEWIKAWEYENVKSAKLTEMNVRVISDSLAIVTGVNVTTRPGPNGRDVIYRDRFTDTWVNRNGQWQVVSAHITRLQ